MRNSNLLIKFNELFSCIVLSSYSGINEYKSHPENDIFLQVRRCTSNLNPQSIIFLKRNFILQQSHDSHVNTLILGWRCGAIWFRFFLAAFVVVMSFMLSGCGMPGNEFRVDAKESDPLIYPPGTDPESMLEFPLDGLSLSCVDAIAEIKNGNDVLGSLVLKKKFFTGKLYAQIDDQTAKKLAYLAREGAYDSLLKALNELQSTYHPRINCVLSCNNISLCKNPGYFAAELIHRQLPRPYSAILRSAYNHRIWSSNGISLDLLPGMRLRIENSLPISPHGLLEGHVHPSSFASPAYLYFHSFTGRELCDPGAHGKGTSALFLCKTDAGRQDTDSFVSVSGGMARLGTRQFSSEGSKSPETNVTKDLAIDTSSLIDLFENVNIDIGARRYWRLWIPSDRQTKLSISGRGSPETLNGGLALLISAATLEDFARLDYEKEKPCSITPKDKKDVADINRLSCYALRYRAVPIPEISVWVNGNREWFPVGSTLADVIGERMHEGFASKSYYFTNSKTDLTAMSEAAAGTVMPARKSLAEVIKVYRLYDGTMHPLHQANLSVPTDITRFLRLQILPGDKIEWQ